jgi:hypothetical protein
MLHRPSLIRVMVLVLALGVGTWPASPVAAQTNEPRTPDAQTSETVQAQAAALLEALDIAEIVAILREEGLSYAEKLDADLLGLRGGRGWARAADRIYGAGRMETTFSQLFAEALPQDPELVALALDFFASERGQRFITLENAARRAMLDDDIDEAARAHAAEKVADNDARLGLIRAIIDANDYIESNVAGGLNSNFAFFLGLRDSGAPQFDLADADILADVWAQEQVIRDDVEEWLVAYLSLAYRPLPDDDLRAYAAFAETAQGRAVNLALFAAFDTLFNTISRELGFEAGRVLSQQDL